MDGTANDDTASPRERWAKGFEDNVTEMREASRWTIGVVAGLLLAATNLSGFGRLYPDSWRFWLAVGATVVVVLAVGRIITMFLRIQVSEESNWETFTPEEFAFVQGFGLLQTYNSFKEFVEDQKTTLEEYAKVRASIGASATLLPNQYRQEVLSRQQDLQDALENMAMATREVEAILGWKPARERFRSARRTLLWVGILAAIAAMTLVWAVNPAVPT